MPPKFLFDISKLDLDRPKFRIDEIRQVNPQRYEFEQLTAIVEFKPDENLIVGIRDIPAQSTGAGKDSSPSEFWMRGHVPGNPLFPGVLMLEAAAQLCSFFQGNYFSDGSFFAFGGLGETKFRSTVRPGDRLVILALGKSVRPRRSVFSCQGIVGETLVFETEITGIRMGGS